MKDQATNASTSSIIQICKICTPFLLLCVLARIVFSKLTFSIMRFFFVMDSEACSVSCAMNFYVPRIVLSATIFLCLLSYPQYY